MRGKITGVGTGRAREEVEILMRGVEGASLSKKGELSAYGPGMEKARGKSPAIQQNSGRTVKNKLLHISFDLHPMGFFNINM